jgi:hypothetical protein
MAKPVIGKETPEELVSKALSDSCFIPAIIGGLAAKDSSKLRCAKALNMLSASHPTLLYPHFDFFVSLLDSRHNILKWNAIIILSNLTKIDTKHRFDAVFDKYYRHLWDGDLVTAANIIGSSGKIASFRPDLRDRITAEILKVELVPLPTSECREIARGKALLAFKEYLVNPEDNMLVKEFIQRCLKSTRPATQSKAERLLKKARRK